MIEETDKPNPPLPNDSNSSTAASKAPVELGHARTPSKAPDVWKLFGSYVWRKLESWIGRKWTAVIFAVIPIVPAAWAMWQWRGDVKALLYDISKMIAEHESLPKADPNVFTVAIVPLVNDDQGNEEFDIVADLKKIRGIDVEQFEKPAISDTDFEAGHARAREYLKQSGAEVLIWGRVLKQGDTRVEDLHWTIADTAGPEKSGRYQLMAQDDLNLPITFTKDLNNVLGLLAVAKGTSFYGQQGTFLANQLAPFIKRVEQLLNGDVGKGWNVADITKIRGILANAKIILGEQSGQNQRLLDAIQNDNAIIQGSTGPGDPAWAEGESSLGVALETLGERERSTDLLKSIHSSL